MLMRLVDKKMRKEDLSLRQAATNAQTSHTTIMRILEGKQVDLETLNNVCNWLGISVVDVLRDQYSDTDKEKEDFLNQFSMFISSDTKLLSALKEVFYAYKHDRLSASDVDEIISFIAYKLSSSKRNV